MLEQEITPFYQQLSVTIAGAEKCNLCREEVATILRPILFPDDERLSTSQVAEHFKRSKITIYRWRKQGKGPAFFTDEFGRVYYTRQTVREYDRKIESDA